MKLVEYLQPEGGARRVDHGDGREIKKACLMNWSLARLAERERERACNSERRSVKAGRLDLVIVLARLMDR